VLHEFEVPVSLAQKYNRSDYLKGKVYDARTKQPLNAKIELYNIGSNQLASTVQSDRKSGEYVSVLTEGAEYALYINKDGYLFKSLSFDFSQKKEYEPLVLDIYLEPIRKGATEILKNIFFKTGKYELELKSQTELDKIVSFLNGNKDLTLEISGHTDDVGKDEDNMALSKKRAQALFDYLIKAGIPKQRIRFQGYGETKPAVPNTSEENRQLNRRIELKVL
jgi:outer membrane protein OmpA-like peptidoglycan-associated protein